MDGDETLRVIHEAMSDATGGGDLFPQEKIMAAGLAAVVRLLREPIARDIMEWRENLGPVLWWRFPMDEPPYVGSPLDRDWPGHHTHWTPIPLPVNPERS